MTGLAIAVIGLTSVAWYALGIRVLKLPAGGVGRAVGVMLEIVGLAVVVLAVDLVTATALILASRAVGSPLSLYFATEKLWLSLALLQALVFHAWWRGPGRLDSTAGSGVDRAMRTPR